MQTEFTCGIYTATDNGPVWHLTTNLNDEIIANIEEYGNAITFFHRGSFNTPALIEIAVLMNNIKRQYKQLQTS